MGAPTVTARCPSCGQGLRATLAPAPPTQWFPCPNCHRPVPVVVPRDLPPLYSWEVVPGLYPQLTAPRPPRWRPTTVAAIALVLAAVLAASAAGVLGYEGYVASEAARYTVSGTVYHNVGGVGSVPLAGAIVVLYSDDNRTFGSTVTGASGTFAFLGVPNGGIALNISATGYSPIILYTFASRSYSTQTVGLGVTLSAGPANNTSAIDLTPFGDLETFLAYSGGAAVLLGVSAVVAAVGAVVVRRPGGAVVAVIGGGAAIAAPVVLLLLSLGSAFLTVTILAGVVGGAGAFALVLATTLVASSGLPAAPG